MNAVLEQFLSESRDFLQGIGESLMELEAAPENASMMGELFRLVHTLKGNSGLFEYPEMTRVLHAAEDLMALVRDGKLHYSPELADRLLEAMDFVSILLDEIEEAGSCHPSQAKISAQLAESLRQLIPLDLSQDAAAKEAVDPVDEDKTRTQLDAIQAFMATVPEAIRMDWFRSAAVSPLLWVRYRPEPECFFKGEDPFYQVRQTPDVRWKRIGIQEDWAPLSDLDAYRCILDFQLVSGSTQDEIDTHFRYVPDQVEVVPVPALLMAIPMGGDSAGAVYDDFVVDALAMLEQGDKEGLACAAATMLELSAASLWIASALRWIVLLLEAEPDDMKALRMLIESLRTLETPRWPELLCAAKTDRTDHAGETLVHDDKNQELLWEVLDAQMEALSGNEAGPWMPGRLKAIAASLQACLISAGEPALAQSADFVLSESLSSANAQPMQAWLRKCMEALGRPVKTEDGPSEEDNAGDPVVEVSDQLEESRPMRRAEDNTAAPKTLKVEQVKIDRLMNLIGEMVVAKNGLPYLATRAESVFGNRDLSREIKSQYTVINRIAEEMQDAIMQVRMMPVSFIFQRFPRLVRDLSRKLGKEVSLVLEGEDTEADKNIIEALADPLIHIVRNSLDHGIELPEVRRAQGKASEGKLLIRASQEADRAVIEIIDDGKGIDPHVVKRKAYEKGLIDEQTLERISDQEAVNLVFAPGFSTADKVSDLSGRGVGMDVVRSAIEKVNGTVSLQSEVGKGARLRLTLPLSMAVTNVMIIESDDAIFGVPMDIVVETVRIPRHAIHIIKNRQAAVLRGRIVPLRSLNELMATDKPQRCNEDDEFATLVIRVQNEHVGIIVDDFREVVDIILKPMSGILAGIPGYAGSALLGDGSVLMVLNPKELL